MNEAEWFSARAPARMLWYIQQRVTQRKLNLFAAACLRRIWHLFPGPESRHAVEMLELSVNGGDAGGELSRARQNAREEGLQVDTGGNQHPSVHAAMAAFYDYPEGIAECAAEATAWVKVGTPEAISGPEEMAQVELLHEIIGNPFQSVSVDPRWLMPTVGDLAATVYEMRALPSGELDPDRLAVLSDALEEAGCDDADILEHLRSAGPHVRGCWALDLILGKQ